MESAGEETSAETASQAAVSEIPISEQMGFKVGEIAWTDAGAKLRYEGNDTWVDEWGAAGIGKKGIFGR